MSDATQEQDAEECDGRVAAFSPASRSSPRVDLCPMSSASSYEDDFSVLKSQLQPSGRESWSIELISTAFNEAMEHTESFILQSFEAILSALASGNASPAPMYLENAVQVLQLFSVYLKSTSELAVLTCQHFYTLPRGGATVMYHVFEHCLKSESVYGASLNLVEHQLKELFQACHSLQLAYWVVLRRPFHFQLAEDSERNILIDAMNKNETIGKIVIDLDVKTAVEQWNGFAHLCKHWAERLGAPAALAAERCARHLATVVVDNIRSCVQVEHDEKRLKRTVKISKFLVFIIYKMYQIFKHNAEGGDYTNIVLLLVTLRGNSTEYLASVNRSELDDLLREVSEISDPLVTELLNNEGFSHALFRMLRRTITESSDVFGYAMLLWSVLNHVTLREDEAARTLWLGGSAPAAAGDNIVCGVIRFMGSAHVWLNYGLVRSCWCSEAEPPPCGLYETLLIMTAALAANADACQYATIEKAMLTSLLEDNEWSAMFASDLWVALARYGPEEVTLDQISYLIDIYKHLERTEGLSKSPKRVHISKTLQRLFNTLSDDHRLSVYGAHNLERDAGSDVVWRAVGVNNLPHYKSKAVSRIIFDKLNLELRKLFSEKSYNGGDVYKLINTLTLSATCVPSAEYVPAEALMELWIKCNVTSQATQLLSKEETTVPERRWFTDLLLALHSLTASLCPSGMFNNRQLIYIINYLTEILEKSSIALKCSTISVLKSLSGHTIPKERYFDTLCKKIAQLFRKLLQDEDLLVRARASVAFEHFSLHTNEEIIITSVLESTDVQLKDSLIYFLKKGLLNSDSNFNWPEQLKLTSQMRFTHKCPFSGGKDNEMEIKEKDNFEMADLEDVFQSDVQGEFVNSDEIEGVLCKLERNTSVLETMEANMFSQQYADRILTLIAKLKNIANYNNNTYY